MDNEVTGLAHDLTLSTNITSLRQALGKLGTLLSTQRFREKLGSAQSESKGWTLLFKSVVVGLDKNRKWRDTVAVLKILIETADRTGAVLELTAVQKFLGAMAKQLTPRPALSPTDGEHVASYADPDIPAEVAPVYLAVMSTLCGRSDYFRHHGLGHDGSEPPDIGPAQVLADKLIVLCVSLTRVDEHPGADGSGGVDGATQSESRGGRNGWGAAARPVAAAAKLLVRLISSFPYALSDGSLASLFRHLEQLVQWSLAARVEEQEDAWGSTSARGTAAGPGGAAGSGSDPSAESTAGSDRRREGMQQVKEFLPQLLSAINTALRRQGADRLEFVWEQLVSSRSVQQWAAEVLRSSDHLALLHEVVQLCRLILRLAKIGHYPLPHGLREAILALAAREMSPASSLRLVDPPQGSLVGRLLRGPLAGSTASAEGWSALCVLQLVADALMLERRRDPAVAAAARPADSSDAQAPKRQRLQPSRGCGVPSWLLQGVCGGGSAATTSGDLSAGALGLTNTAGGPDWRWLLQCAVCLRRRPPLDATSVGNLAPFLLGVAAQCAEEHERASAISATLALLALCDAAPASSSGTAWNDVWRVFWSMETSAMTTEAARADGGIGRAIGGFSAAVGGAANEAALHADLRREVLSRLLQRDLVTAATTATAASEASAAFFGAAGGGARVDAPRLARGLEHGVGAQDGGAVWPVGWVSQSRQALACELWARNPAVLERAACNELAVALALDLSGPAVGAPLLWPRTLLLAPGGAFPPAGGDNGRHTSHAWTHWLTLRAQLLLASVGVRLERRMGSFLGPHRPDGPDSPEAAADMSYAARTEGCRMVFAATEEGEAERILAQLDCLIEDLSGAGGRRRETGLGIAVSEEGQLARGEGHAWLLGTEDPAWRLSELGRLSAGAEVAMQDVCARLEPALMRDAPALHMHLQALCMGALVLLLTGSEEGAGRDRGIARARLVRSVVASATRGLKRLAGCANAQTATAVPLLLRLLVLSSGEEEMHWVRSVAVPRVLEQSLAQLGRKLADAGESPNSVDPMEEDDLDGRAEERKELEDVCHAWLDALAVLCEADGAGGRVLDPSLLGERAVEHNVSFHRLLRIPNLPDRLPRLCLRLVTLPHAALLERQMELLIAVAESGESEGWEARLCECLQTGALLLRGAHRSHGVKGRAGHSARRLPARAATTLLAGCSRVLMLALGSVGGASLGLAVATIHASVEWVKLAGWSERFHGSTWRTAVQAAQLQDVRPHMLRALPQLLQASRRLRFGDSLRLHMWILPHLSVLGLAETLPIAAAQSLHQPLEVHLGLIRCCAAILTRCRPARQRSVLLALCTRFAVLRALEHVVLPVLHAGCAAAGGFRMLLTLHLAWLVEQWLDSSRSLLDFPAHWLDAPAPSEASGACPPFSPDELRTRLRLLLERHRSIIVPSLIVGAAVGKPSRQDSAARGDAAGSTVRQELERASRLLQVPETEMLKDSMPHLIGRWLPTKFLTAPASARWQAIETIIIVYVRGAHGDGGGTIKSLIRSQVDHILQCLVSLDTATWVAPGDSPAEVAGVLLKALRYLADQVAQGTLPADLLFGTSGRALELLLLLHHRHAAAARAGTPRDLHRESLLVLLELMTSSEEVVPQRLRAEEHTLRHLNLVALSRILQHAALTILATEDAEADYDDKALLVRRCCNVLKPVLHAVLEATPDALNEHGVQYGNHRDAAAQLGDFKRDHSTALISALLVRADSSHDASALLEYAIGRLEPPALSMLPPLPDGVPFAALTAKCERARAQTSLAAMLDGFVRLSEWEVAGAGLASRLQQLLLRLESSQGAAELREALSHASIEHGSSAVSIVKPTSSSVHQLVRAARNAAQRLLMLSRSTSSTECQWLIARCLGALLRNGLPQRALRVAAPAAAHHDRELRSDLAQVFPKLLLLLHGYLTDADELAMLLAADALREALKSRSNETKEAWRDLTRRHLLVASELEAYAKPLPAVAREPLHFAPARVEALAAMSASDPALMQAAHRPQTTSGLLAGLNAALPELWSIRGKTVDRWICSLAENLLRHSKRPLLLQCRQLAARKPALARLCLLPALLDLLEDVRDDNRFVASLARAFARSFDDALSCDPAPSPQERQATEIQLRLLLETRAHSMPRQPHDGWKFPALWSAVDFYRAAQAAHAAGGPLTALQLLEASAEFDSELQPQTVLQRPAAATLLMEILAVLPAPDATLGMTTLVLDSNPGTQQLFAAQNDGLDRLSLLDTARQVQLSNVDQTTTNPPDSDTFTLRMADTLREMGCDHLYAACMRRPAKDLRSFPAGTSASVGEIPAVREARAEAAWRLGQWEEEEETQGGGRPLVDAELGVHQQLYGALSSVRQGRPTDAWQAMRGCTCELVRQLGQLGDEGGKRLDELTISLRLCMEACEVAMAGAKGGAAAAVVGLSVAAVGLDVCDTLTEQADQDEYRRVEPVLALYASLLRSRADVNSAGDSAPLAHVLLGWALRARQTGNLPMAAARLTELLQLPLSPPDRAQAVWEQAQLLWRAGADGVFCDRANAAAIAAKLLDELQSPLAGQEHLAVDVCSKLAVWKTVEHSTPWAGREAASELHERAVGLCDSLSSEALTRRCNVHHAYASFLEAQYRAGLGEKNSPYERRLEQLYTHACGELSRLDETLDGGAQSGDEPSEGIAEARAALLAHIHQHEQRLEAGRQRMLRLARLAFDQHALSAQHGDLHNYASTFAMLSLWFAHPETLSGADERLRSIPSRQLLPLVPQLACRLGGHSGIDCATGESTSVKLQAGLQRLLLHIGAEHVNQVLPHFLALALGDHFSPREPEVIADESQLHAALGLRDALKNKLLDTDKSGVVDETHHLFMLYLQMAWVDVATTRSVATAGKDRAPSLDKLVNIEMTTRYSTTPGKQLYDRMQRRGLPSIAPVLTRDVDATRSEEESYVTVDGFSPPSRDGSGRRCAAEFNTAGGVNLPKIIQCFGSDGNVYKQLVKGRDDGRQDAALQEVFSLVNILLRRDPQTRQRDLHLRTYRIIPLAPTAALLQWVDNSIPLMSFLTNSKDGAHERHRPRDLKAAEARQMMHEARERENKRQKGPHLLKAYEQVTERLKPVLHYFFLERWPQASAWYERRLAYARSLATNSMAGFIVGLGDRHSSNILLDNETAELIHIDLGIAFDQGSLLKIPEVVPFRLTRDLVDALGVCDVEGPMRGSAEHAMRVLRANAESLLAILQLVVHNPLYKWSQEKQMQERQLQKDPSAHQQPSRNPEAERALSRVQLKLEGREVGRLECLSVEGQVWQLINQARDPANLCRMFEGWAAWL